MQKQRRCSGGTERSRNLARDQSAFTHSSHDDARTATEEQLDSQCESLSHGTGNAVGKFAESLGLHSNDIGACTVHEVTMLSNVCAAALVTPDDNEASSEIADKPDVIPGDNCMKLRLAFVAFLILSTLPAFGIVDGYHTGILVHARPSQGEGKGCVTLTVLLENLVFVAQQCAALPWNTFVPAEFTEQGDVQVRVEEDKLLLKRPSGKELRAKILKKALLRTRVDLEEFWRRNAADRDEGAPPQLPQENGTPMAVSVH
jgi:hypothetical protein